MSNAELLHAISQAAENYSPSDQATETLRSKVFVPLLGPFATGKSAIAKQVANESSRFCYVTSFKTRQPRGDEPPHGPHFVDPNDAEALQRLKRDVEDQRLIDIIAHPETGHFYGTRSDAFAAPYCVLETMPCALDYFGRLPFDSVRPIAIVTEPEEWLARLDARYPDSAPNRSADVRKRLDEGIQNIQYSLDNPEVQWINNSKRGVASAAQELIILAQHDLESHPNNRRVGQALLHAMEDFRSVM